MKNLLELNKEDIDIKIVNIFYDYILRLPTEENSVEDEYIKVLKN